MSHDAKQETARRQNGRSAMAVATAPAEPDEATPYADDPTGTAAPDRANVVEALITIRAEERGSAGVLAEGEPLFRSDTMLESLRYENYDFVHGIGELVDNSVESGAHNVWVMHKREKLTVRKVYQKTYDVVSEVAVVDDGEGMSRDVLGKALVLGETCRPRRGTTLGIGRFGVGMTLGSLSLARRIDVYSRVDKTGPFYHTALDLDLVNTREQRSIPTPVEAAPPAEYGELLRSSTGTIVILTRCDRLQQSQTNQDKPIPADDHVAGLANWLGRTYRKFIANGLNVWLDGSRVYLHDPLYLLGPTVWDAKGKNDPRATDLGTQAIELEVPGDPGKTAKVTIRMTLLPREFREKRLQGGKGIAKERRVDENEGISILRADREVLYDRVPYLYAGAFDRGNERDRFWSCEISFPPELDPYFTVRYIKRGAEPVPFLRKDISKLISPTIKTLREQISREFDKDEAQAAAEQSAFTAAEDAMAAADRTLPRPLRGTAVTREEEDATLDEVAAQSVSVADAPADERPARKAAEKKRLVERPYSIVAVRYPANVFFTTRHLFKKTVIELNTDHVFYKTVFEPLCGSVHNMGEDADVETGTITPEQRRARDAFMMLLLAYGRAEAMFGDDPLKDETPAQVFENLRAQWGIALGAALTKVDGAA